MDNEKYNELVDSARKRLDGILKVKGHDYSGEVDRLANFKRVGENLGIMPVTALATYMHKHWDSIMTFVREGKLQSEPIDGRLDDLHNYLYLLEGLIKEVGDKPIVGLAPIKEPYKFNPDIIEADALKATTTPIPAPTPPVYSPIPPRPAPTPAPGAPVFGMDVDGVCANFTKGITQQMRKMDLQTPDEEEVREYDFGRWNTEFKIAFGEVKLSYDFWLRLEPYPIVLPFLRKVYVTARPIDSSITWFWLFQNGFPDAPVVTVDELQGKVEVLQNFGVTVYVEDRPSLFKDINDAGIKCYLMDRPWNQEVKAGKLRIKGWREIAEAPKALKERN